MFGAKVHRRIYLVLMALLGGCMVTSIALSNVVWVLLLANWVLEGRWREKWQMARESRLLQAITILFLLHLASMLWTEHYAIGWHVVEGALPLMAIPLVVLTTRPPMGRPRQFLLCIYATTVIVVSAIGLVRWLTIPDLPYRLIVPFISHIRFSLNCCMVIYLLLGGGKWMADGGKWKTIVNVGRWLLIVWLLAFLLLLRSYTAFAVLIIVSLILILTCRRRWQWLALWVLVVAAMGTVVWLGCRSYYRMVPLATQPLASTTANGRPYIHLQDGFIENGNYVNNYLCPEEMDARWLQRTGIPVDSLTPDGHPIWSVLIRYLNALGLPKDSVGVATLSNRQCAEIMAGVPNPVYSSHSQLKKMIYTALFEYENYRCYHVAKGFSNLQRLEMAKAACNIIGEHPWLGVGSGDLHDAMNEQYYLTGSSMQGDRCHPHNEYLTLTALFGIPAVVLLLLLFLRASPALRRQSPLMVAWMVTILVSFLSENTLDSLAGILFCTWFLAFRSPSTSHR
ncbi:MAG: O-antigen ligase family protein [bacterium]